MFFYEVTMRHICIQDIQMAVNEVNFSHFQVSSPKSYIQNVEWTHKERLLEIFSNVQNELY